MAKWETPVIDRTIEDVKAADPSAMDYQKGALNADDLNRIEGNYKYILDNLEQNSITITHKYRSFTENGTTYTDWNEQNLPWYSEISRIRANYNALVREYLSGLGLPTFGQNNYLMYTEVNAWESIAVKGKEIFENMSGTYRRCNQHICGDGFIDCLPYDKASKNRLGIPVLGAFVLGYD